MSDASDVDWAEISKLAGGLPDAARDEYTAKSSEYFEDPKRDFEVRCPRTTEAVNDALKLTKKLSKPLSILKRSKSYRCYNTGVSLRNAELESFDRLLERLSSDSERFKKKNMRNNAIKCGSMIACAGFWNISSDG